MSSSGVALDLATSLSLLGSAVDAHVVNRLRAAGFEGVRPGHGYVFQRLLLGASTAGEMADALDVTQQAVSKTVTELVALGYVRQVADRSDRRRRPVELTERGRRLIDTARRIRTDFEGMVEDAVGTRRLTTALRVLTEVVALLGLADRVHSRSVPQPPHQDPTATSP